MSRDRPLLQALPLPDPNFTSTFNKTVKGLAARMSAEEEAEEEDFNAAEVCMCVCVYVHVCDRKNEREIPRMAPLWKI